MGKAIEMKDAEAPSTTAKPPSKESKEEAPPAPPAVADQLSAIVALLEASVRAKETRVLVGRLLRQTTAVRCRLNTENLTAFIKTTLPDGFPGTDFLLSQLSSVRPPRPPYELQCLPHGAPAAEAVGWASTGCRRHGDGQA